MKVKEEIPPFIEKRINHLKELEKQIKKNIKKTILKRLIKQKTVRYDNFLFLDERGFFDHYYVILDKIEKKKNYNFFYSLEKEKIIDTYCFGNICYIISNVVLIKAKKRDQKVTLKYLEVNEELEHVIYFLSLFSLS